MPESIADLIAELPPTKKYLQQFEDLPGWSYLGFVLTVASIWAPKTIRVFDTEHEVPSVVVTVAVFAATWVFYFAGDWFNDHFWKLRPRGKTERDDRFTDAWLGELEMRRGRRALWRALGAPHGVDSTRGPRNLATKWLGVTAGCYKVALAIGQSAGSSLDYGVWWPNEVAKTSRSFIIPFAAVALIAAILGHVWIALGFIVGVLLALRLYVTLKFEHVRRLYVAVNRCREEGRVRFNDHCLVDGRKYRIFIVGKTHVVASATG